MSRRLSGLFILGVLLQACAAPAERLHATALSQGFLPRTLKGNDFLLVTYYKPPERDDGTLHVYLEGDGTPWLTPQRVASDPTPRNPLMLRLMGMDSSAALYLGRPCYNGHAGDPACSPLLWTHRRYAPEVVFAMAAALRGFLDEHHYGKLAFMGHSGGGVLALLLARHFAQTRRVTTLAAPLDIDAWTDHHGFSRLEGSLNPARELPAGFPEVHYFGAQDERTPATLFDRALAKMPRARAIVIDRFDHVCCWEDVWRQILREMSSSQAGL